MLSKKNIPEIHIKKNPIGRLASLFVNRFELTVLVIIMLLVLGVTSLFLLPKESLPEIVFPSLTVQTIYPGANPNDVEAQVTKPIEKQLASLDDVTEITSVSNYGFSFISVSFDESVDINQKNIELDNALADVSLPVGALDPVSNNFNTSEIPLISISLSGAYDIDTLTVYAETLSEQLERIPGVETVQLFGTSEREVTVLLDPESLVEAGLTSNQVISALEGNNISFPLGETTIDDTTFSLRVDETISTLNDIENLIVFNQLGQAYRISDLATVSETLEAPNGYNRSYTRDNGLNNSIFISVIRKNQSDVVGTSDAVKTTVNDSIGTLLPNDLNAVVTNDTAINVKDDLNSIQSNALSGLIVVILVLFLFIGFRESLIVSITIPLTLLTTLGLLGFFGITLNTFAILGLIVALGLLVDNTIIVMENMDRLSKKGASFKDSAVYGTNQVGLPITAATLTTVAAFFPLAILPGIIGAFINTIPRTIILALMTSLVLAIIVTPAVYHFVYKHVKNRTLTKKQDFFLKLVKIAFVGILSLFAFYGEDVWIGVPIIGVSFFVIAMAIKSFGLGKFGKTLKPVERYKEFILDVTKSRLKMAAILLIAVAVLASSINLIISDKLKIAFFPESEPISITLEVDTPAGYGLDQTESVVGDIESILVESPHVDQFNTTIGGNESDFARIVIDLTDSEVSGYDQVTDIRNDLSAITEAELSIQGNGAAGPPVGKPIEIKIVGDDLEANGQYADSLVTQLASIDGVYNIDNSLREGRKELVFNVDQEKASEMGLSASYISFSLKNLIDGQVATRYSKGNELLDVRVKVDGQTISDYESIELTTPFGQVVSLSEVVTLEETTGISGINREEGNRVITITSDLENGYNAGDVVAELQALMANISVPDGSSVLYEGEAAGISDSFSNLFRSLIIAVFLVFIILTIQFGSIKQPFVIITTIPMALIGVLYGLTITGNEFGFYAFMALVSLVGIAVNDAIVLIDYMNYLRKEGYGFYESIAKAAKTRFNPVLATTLTTIGGILPLSYKNAYYAQFGYSLIFGLLITTLMTLILIPIMYALIEGRQTRKLQKRSSKDSDDFKINTREPLTSKA